MGESIVGNKKGLLKTRAVRRVPVEIGGAKTFCIIRVASRGSVVHKPMSQSRSYRKTCRRYLLPHRRFRSNHLTQCSKKKCPERSTSRQMFSRRSATLFDVQVVAFYKQDLRPLPKAGNRNNEGKRNGKRTSQCSENAKMNFLHELLNNVMS